MTLQKTPDIPDPEPERYYEWMLWKGRQQDMNKTLQKAFQK